MDLLISRREFSDRSTIGDFSINGKFQCYVLEPVDRGLHAGMSLEEIKKIKIPERTAIPYGRYKVIMAWSGNFKMFVPLYLAIPGFDSVEFHIGCKPSDTHACTLPGLSKQRDMVLNSTKAFNLVVPQINSAFERGEEIWITIEKAKENLINHV